MDEAVVRRLWLGGWPRGALAARDGTRLDVVYAGRSGRGAGPDLRDAIVALADGTLVRGDVELHVRSSDWRAHGHGGDPRYAGVVLHVVWRDDLADPIELPGGGRPLTLALADQPEAWLFDRLRGPHPAGGTPAEEPYHEWLQRLGPDELGAFLDHLGDERLAAKAARISADLHALGSVEALHRAICDALGYSQNRAAFARLAELVPAGELRATALAAPDAASAERDCLARLFGAAGMIAEVRVGRVPDEAGRTIADGYRERFEALAGGPAMAAGNWELIGVRPANRPTRRLAGLARIAAGRRAEPLDNSVLAALSLPEPRAAVRALHDLAYVPGVLGRAGAPREADFWAWHHDFGRRLPGAPLALVGEDRARTIVANVLLPFGLAVADARGDAALESDVRAAWALAPSGASNWITAEMRPLLGARSLSRARREQGAIELYRRCCEERRCATCPAASAQELVATRG